MNQHPSHLTDDQIERYMRAGHEDDLRADAHIEPYVMEAQAVGAHIADCDSCRGRLLESGRRNLGLGEGTRVRMRPYPDCPGDDLLMEFAAGLCAAPAASQILQHVSGCDYCAPLLKVFLQDSPEPKTESATLPAQDALAMPAARVVSIDKNARINPSIAPAPVMPSPNFIERLRSWFSSFSRRQFAGAGGLAFAAMTLAAAPPLVNLYNLHEAQNLAAAAFTEKRTTEMRFSWAPYAEQNVTRGENSSSAYDRPKLIAAIGEANKRADSSDPRWIRLQARVDLLSGNAQDVQRATELLKQASDGGLDDPATEIDRAVAFVQTAQQEQHSDRPNLGLALDLLEQAAGSPKAAAEERAAALFNLAIVYGKMLLWDKAVSTWEEYLKLDSTSKWAEEARQRLEEAKKKVPPPRSQGYRTPSYFLRHFNDPEVRGSVEEYQDYALRSWLPDALNNANNDPDAWPALRKLASQLQEDHGDPWLHDFLQTIGPGDLQAVHALAEALTSNRRGFSVKAMRSAETAASLFRQSGNHAGALWARFENAYAQQRAVREHNCLEQAASLDRALRPTSYKWLQAQVALEEQSCDTSLKRFDAAQRQSEIARKVAAAAQFHSLGLRALAFEADLNRELGCARNWASLAEGLERYWQGPALPVRLYTLYNRIADCLQKDRFLYAARALQERQIGIWEREVDSADRNASAEASIHKAMANIFKDLHEDNLKLRETAIVEKLKKQASEDYPIYELVIELQRANSQLGAGDARGALSTIKDSQAMILNTDDDLLRLGFYRVLGDIYWTLKDLDQAETAYKRGLQDAENGMGSLKEPGKRRQWMKETGEVYRGIVDALLERKEDKEALQFWEWYQARSSAAEASLAAKPGKSSWEQIEKEVLAQPLPVAASETRLVFAGLRDRFHVWIVNKSGMRTLWIAAKPKDLAAAIHEFAEKCGSRDSNELELEQQSRKLFTLLLQPAMREIGDSSLVVADLDPSMDGLPLEALKSPEGWYFGQRYATIYSSGFLNEMKLRQSTGPMPESGLLLDASASAAGPYPTLDRTERESLAQFFPGLDILDGAQATPRTLSRQLDASLMFLFIGHGNQDGLVLNPGWILKPEDLAPQSLRRLRFAVLAACSTATAANTLGETNALVNAFLAGGVPSVVASHWEVDSRSTAQLMTSFYAGLKNGHSAAQSMREARQQVFHSHSHPYYWAAFSLSGRMS